MPLRTSEHSPCPTTAHLWPLAALAAVALVACGPSGPVPDAIWEVTVTGKYSNCTSDESGYQETFNYAVFFDGAAVDIRIDESPFASGVVSGCTIRYETPLWLEDRGDDIYLRWVIEGTANYQYVTGQCDIADGYDWWGSETITVEESTDDDVVAGCTYELETSGVLVEG